MKEWLAKIRPPKYLRYFFFIAYSWYRRCKSEKDDAHNSAMILLGTFHGILILSLVFMIIPEQIFTNNKYYTVLPIVLFLFLIFYYLFQYRNKWKSFVTEFNHIKKPNQKIGLIFLFFYYCIYFNYFFLGYF